MTRLALIAAVFAVGATPTFADVGAPDSNEGISETGPALVSAGVMAPVSIVEGPGIKIGEGTVLHPIVGLETAFVSNTFYEESDPIPAGLLRLVAQVYTASLSKQRLGITEGAEGEPNLGSHQWRAGVRLSYDFYLSGNNNVQEQGGLGVGALLRGHVLPQSTWSFLYLDNFERIIRATNFETAESTNRDINRLQLGIQFAPQGRSVYGLLHAENVLDYFEDDDQHFASRNQNTIGLTVGWRFRPVTVLFADVSQGYFTGLGSDTAKIDSYPLTTAVGIQTLLSLKTTLIARVGYTNGFYSSGPNYSTVLGGVQFGYRYSPNGRITGLYEYVHQDSINANFYRDHAVRLTLEQQLAPLLFTASPEVRIRRYEGVMSIVPGGADTRDDVIFAVEAGLRYSFRQTIAGVLEYRFSSVSTDYVSGIGGDDPSYVRHEVIAGVRAAL
jgi:opacity protein-like surface antigen